MTRRRRTTAAGLSVAALALGLRVASLRPFVDGWDPAEYTMALEQDFFPHGPYLFYLLCGRWLHALMPAGLGLSVLSGLAALAAGLGLLALLRQQRV